MSERHIREDQKKVVLRGTKQIGTEDDGESFRGHLILLLIIGYSEADIVSESESTQRTQRRTCRDVQILISANQSWHEEGHGLFSESLSIFRQDFRVLRRIKH